MYPPVALALTLGINLVLAKPFLLLMERIRVMIEIDLETRIWGILCSLPALFMLIASIAQFLTTIDIDRNVIVHMLFVLFAIFAFIVYGVFFGVMGYICRKKEEERVSECMLEGYRKQAENNEYILEAHHEIRHHMNALSAYLKERDIWERRNIFTSLQMTQDSFHLLHIRRIRWLILFFRSFPKRRRDVR